MGQLESALAAPAQGRLSPWTGEVRSALDGLDECMKRHVEQTEGPDGFHADIVAAAPRLAHQVSLSVREHRRITGAVAGLRTATATADSSDGNPSGADSSGAAGADRIRSDGTALLALLARHRQRGADMIFQAYEAEVGDGD
jgi:hypothetical protein